MKKVKNVIRIVGLLLLSMILIGSLYLIKTNNTAYLFVDKYETGGQAGVKKLDEMIKDAWLNRDFFEVIVYSRDFAPFCLNYNMSLKSLSVSTDLRSGWSSSNKLTVEELENLTKQDYSTKELFSVIRKYPDNHYYNLESRIEGIPSFF